MALLRPGEFKITDMAFENMNISKGGKVLDVGCGEGDTVKYLAAKGFDMCGIDINFEKVKVAKELNPTQEISFGDGEFLGDFPSRTFDCVMMECVLSLINLPDESVHEAYCVLKNGGKLYISDLMVKNPTPQLVQTLAIEAERRVVKEREAGSCASHGEEHGHDNEHEGECACDDIYIPKAEDAKFVKFKSQGRFIVSGLIEELEEIGFVNIKWEDVSKELDVYVAEKIMADGSIEGVFNCEALNATDDHKTGYFMLTAEKPM